MIIDNSGTGIASLGRDEDRFVAHVAPGERVVPPVISADTQARLSREMMAAGLDPDEYIVGPHMSINPITGQPEFGWFKKKFKSLKKVIKKVAPIAAVIPGPWQPFAAVYQKGNALNNIVKGDGGIGDLLTLGAGGSQKLFGDKGAFANIKAGTGITDLGYVGKNLAFQAKDFASSPLDYLGNIGKTYGENQRQGYGGIFSNVGGADTLGGQTFNAVISGGNPVNSMITAGYTPGMEGGMIPTSNQSGGGDITTWLNNNFDTSDRTMINGQVAIRAKDGNYYTQEQAKQMYDQQQQPGFFGAGKKKGQSYVGVIEDFLKGRKSDFSTEGSGRIGIDGRGIGSIFGGNPGQSEIGRIEDFIKGNPSDPVRDSSGGMFGGNAGAASLAALMGKVVYDAAKERKGGLAETPKVTMDQLGRYQMAQNLGTGGSRADFGLAPAPVALQFAYGGEARQYFNQGGLATMIGELDMRDGGESAGPGTGTSDDIPAMLSDGEFVMTAAATRGAGAFDVNKTKSGIELVKGGSASREEGVKNMRELMNIFEAI